MDTTGKKLQAKRLWDSSAEECSYEILKELINLNNYNIFQHVCLKDIFPAAIDDIWANYSIDFIITDKKGLPVLGIEINGMKHWNNSETRKHDKIKKELFFNAAIPLICIPISEMTNYSNDEYAVKYKKELRLLLINYLTPFYYKSTYPVYCWECNTQNQYKYKNDCTSSFYCCENINCNSTKTLSSNGIPPLLSEAFSKFIQDIYVMIKNI